MKKTVYIIAAAMLLSISADANWKDLLKECDSIIIGEKGDYYEQAGRHLYEGDKVKLEKHTFTLPEKVYEVHCSAFKTDFNADGRSDYIYVAAGTGNGSLFGLCDVYIFVSCPADAKEEITFGHIKTGADNEKFRYAHISSYGIRAMKSADRILLEGTTLSEDRRTYIRHYYSFDRDGWMREIGILLDNGKNISVKL